MRSLATKIFIVLLVLTTVQAGLNSNLGVLYSKCNALWVACVTAAGGIEAMTISEKEGIPKALLACNAA